MAAWRQDLTYAFRRLSKSPGFAAAAVVSIGLGIAANSTIFSMVSTFLLRPAPVGDPATLMAVFTTQRSECCNDTISWLLFKDLGSQVNSFSAVAGYYAFMPASISGNGEPERVWGQPATTNFFDVAQLHMELGRGFTSDEDRLPVIVLSHTLWQRRFGGDPNITGKSISLSGRPFTVVGVAPPSFHGLDLVINSEFWVPMRNIDQLLPKTAKFDSRDYNWLTATARLKPGVTRTQAAAELGVLAQRLAKDYPQAENGRAFRLELTGALQPKLKSQVTMFLAGLSVVVLLVLCIACANVANLLLSQASSRQREMAVRLALGATRGQLLRQMLTESLLLALCGGLLGVTLSLWATQALSAFHLPVPVPLDIAVGVDWRVLLYTSVLSFGTALLFGLAPALAASRPIISSALKGEDVLARPGRRWTLRNVLVVSQIAMSLVLLVCHGSLPAQPAERRPHRHRLPIARRSDDERRSADARLHRSAHRAVPHTVAPARIHAPGRRCRHVYRSGPALHGRPPRRISRRKPPEILGARPWRRPLHGHARLLRYARHRPHRRSGFRR